MQTSIEINKENAQSDEATLKNREEIPGVLRYLNNSMGQMRSLEYFIDDIFDADELFDVLEEDLPSGNCKEYFIKDIVHLCEFFFELTKSKKIRIQVEVVRTDMCRLFHIDNIRQRLLCTYMGPGTEWLDNSNVNRDGLGKGCNKNIVKDFKQINKAKTFEVLLLRGIKYKNEKSAVVHRSPPVETDFQTRILLKIDEC